MAEKRKCSDPIPKTSKKPRSEPTATDTEPPSNIPAEDISAPENAPPTKPSAVEPVDNLEKFTSLPLPSPFTGKFDLFYSKLSFLQCEYLPEGAIKPDFMAVHTAILFYQKKPDFSLRCALRTNPAGKSIGRLKCPSLTNPITSEPLESVYIVEGETKDSVRFDTTESVHMSNVGEGIGYEAKMDLDVDGDVSIFMIITSGAGTFKMRKVWEDQPTGRELFEGYWNFKVTYDKTFGSLGLGSSKSFGFPFWAVRALKKQGEEVGIDAGTGNYVPFQTRSLAGFPGLSDSLTPSDPAFDPRLRGLLDGAPAAGALRGDLSDIVGRFPSFPDLPDMESLLAPSGSSAVRANGVPSVIPGFSHHLEALRKELNIGRGDPGLDPLLGHLAGDGPPPKLMTFQEIDSAINGVDELVARLENRGKDVRNATHANHIDATRQTGVGGVPGKGPNNGDRELHPRLADVDSVLGSSVDAVRATDNADAMINKQEPSHGQPNGPLAKTNGRDIREADPEATPRASTLNSGGLPDAGGFGTLPKGLGGFGDLGFNPFLRQFGLSSYPDFGDLHTMARSSYREAGGVLSESKDGLPTFHEIMAKMKADTARLNAMCDNLDAEMAGMGPSDGGLNVDDFLDDSEFDSLMDRLAGGGGTEDLGISKRLSQFDPDVISKGMEGSNWDMVAMTRPLEAQK